MKKSILLSLAFLTLFSCTKEEPKNNISEKTQMEFTSEMSSITKTVLNSDLSVSWKEGDAISVFAKNNLASNEKFTLKSMDGSNAVFTGLATKSDTYFAIYPYNGKNKISGNTATLEILSKQVAEAGTFANSVNPSVAVTETNELVFHNVASLVSFSVPDLPGVKFNQAILSGNASEKLSGEMTVELVGTSVKAVPTDRAVASVALSGDLKPGSTYYFVLAPNSFKQGIKIVLKDAEGKVYEKAGQTSMELLAGQVQPLGVIDVEAGKPVILPSAKLSWASCTQLAIKYSNTEFKDRAKDVNSDFKLALYKDEACKQLQLAIDLPRSLQKRTMFINKNYFPGFVFSGLKPETDYWCKVTLYDKDAGNQEGPAFKFRTLADDNVDVSKLSPASANVGDVVLCENFDQLVWGGDMVAQNCAVSRGDRGAVEGFSYPTGDCTGSKAVTLDQNVKSGFFMTHYGNEYGLYNSLGKSTRKTRLAGWAQMHEYAGASTGTLCSRPGMVKFGAGSKLGIILTPELKCLKGTATVKVKFRALNYNEEATGVWDHKTKALFVVEGTEYVSTTSNYAKAVYGNAKKTETTFDMDCSKYEWKDYEIILKNVKPTSRIGIGGSRVNASKGQNRFYLDKISIEVVSYE